MGRVAVAARPRQHGRRAARAGFSATQTLEAHLAIATGKHVRLSAQSLPTASTTSSSAAARALRRRDRGARVRAREGARRAARGRLRVHRATARNTTVEPERLRRRLRQAAANEALPLQRALATVGPVSISVAAGAWDARRRISTAARERGRRAGSPRRSGTRRTPDHQELVGRRLGREGVHLPLARERRLLLATDHNPAVGSACKDTVGGKYPETVEVRGMCACLSDPRRPTGARRRRAAAADRAEGGGLPPPRRRRRRAGEEAGGAGLLMPK